MENKHSQLHVIRKEKVVGVVPYESVANTIFNFLEHHYRINYESQILREE